MFAENFKKSRNLPNKLPKISEKVARNLSKCCSKVPQKNQNVAFPATKVDLLFFFGVKQKYLNCTRKVRFLSIFVEFCAVTSMLNNFVLN